MKKTVFAAFAIAFLMGLASAAHADYPGCTETGGEDGGAWGILVDTDYPGCTETGGEDGGIAAMVLGSEEE